MPDEFSSHFITPVNWLCFFKFIYAELITSKLALFSFVIFPLGVPIYCHKLLFNKILRHFTPPVNWLHSTSLRKSLFFQTTSGHCEARRAAAIFCVIIKIPLTPFKIGFVFTKCPIQYISLISLYQLLLRPFCPH